MGKYRTRLQIVADILSVVSNNDAKKTRIMYVANLSWQLLNQYLSGLVDAGLVSFSEADCYVLTRKGERFFKRIAEYRERRKKLEEESKEIENERMILENMCFNAKIKNPNLKKLFHERIGSRIKNKR